MHLGAMAGIVPILQVENQRLSKVKKYAQHHMLVWSQAPRFCSNQDSSFPQLPVPLQPSVLTCAEQVLKTDMQLPPQETGISERAGLRVPLLILGT